MSIDTDILAVEATARTVASAVAVFHFFVVCAFSAIASTASGVSKPGKPATSNPPSGCCCVASHAVAADAVARACGSLKPL